MSLKKLIEEITQPIVEDIGGIVAGDGTIKGGSKLSKIKKMKKKGHTSVPYGSCLLYTSPSPRDATLSRMPSSA